MTLGEWIRQYRFSHGMSQRDFADRVKDLSKSQIAAVETGRIKTPSYKTFAAVADACGLTPEELASQCRDTKMIDIENANNQTEREEISKLIYKLPDRQIHTILELIKGLLR